MFRLAHLSMYILVCVMGCRLVEFKMLILMSSNVYVSWLNLSTRSYYCYFH